jgi:hypothetical protein
MRPLKVVVLVVSCLYCVDSFLTHHTTDSAKPSYLFECQTATKQRNNGTMGQWDKAWQLSDLCQMIEQRTNRDGSLATVRTGIATKDLLNSVSVVVDHRERVLVQSCE